MIRQLGALVLVAAGLLTGCAEDVTEPASAEAVADRAMDRLMRGEPGSGVLSST